MGLCAGEECWAASTAETRRSRSSGGQLGHAQVMQCGGSHAAGSVLLDHFGHEEQASFDGGGALLVGFALVGPLATSSRRRSCTS